MPQVGGAGPLLRPGRPDGQPASEEVEVADPEPGQFAFGPRRLGTTFGEDPSRGFGVLQSTKALARPVASMTCGTPARLADRRRRAVPRSSKHASGTHRFRSPSIAMAT